MQIHNALIVASGGALGALLRWVTQGLLPEYWGLPLVNLAGAFAMGYLVGGAGLSDAAKLFLLTGVLGGFTTMSGFSLEMHSLILSDRYMAAVTYWAVSSVLTVALCFAGFRLSVVS
jgi:CrcB protein